MTTFLPRVAKRVFFVNYQQVRCLPRWSHRRPVTVIPAENYDSQTDAPIHWKEVSAHIPEKVVNERDFAYRKIKWKQPDPLKFPKHSQTGSNIGSEGREPEVQKPLTVLSKSHQAKKAKQSFDMLETVIDQDGNFVYTKMADNDLRISKIMTVINSKKEKEKKELMVLEGKRLIVEALLAGCKLEYILFSRMKELEYLRPFLPKLGAELYKMPYREMQMWSGLTTNPGIMGIFKIPDLEETRVKNPIPLTVICDNVREPNNLGSILRICCGVGCEQVILSKGCVNVWDSKVLRSSSGSHFRLRINRKLDWEEIRKGLPENSAVFIADNSTINAQSEDDKSLDHLVKNVPVFPYFAVDFKMAEYIVIIIGGETEGISEQSYQLATDFRGVRLNIPLSNNMDSLNTGTALGIIAFEIKRQICSSVNSNLEKKSSSVKSA